MEKQKSSVSGIRESVNPVFKTARSCVTVNALLGDKDAQKLMCPLGFDMPFPDPDSGKMTAEMREFAAQMSNPGFNIMVESRFAATNRYIPESGRTCVADLPCGYTPRGIKLADTGIRYFGMDIPAVAEEIAPAVKKVIGENERIRYFDVDATNYGSLKKALADAQGELLITTEGLLMYLTQPELDEVFRNIHAILEEYGGEWITTDNEILAAHYRLMAVLNGEVPAKAESGQKPPSPVPENDFMKAAAARQYAEKMGFNVRKVPVFDHLPDSMLSLRDMTDEKRNAVRSTFKEMFFWVMTVRETRSESTHAEDIPFSIRADTKSGRLDLAVSGRLDTITAPELLSAFQDEFAKGDISSATLDLSSLTYISSAGLRVFLIMRKALAGGEFHARNMNDTVREILYVTGFSDLFD